MLKCQTCLRGDFTAVTNKVACVVRTVCIALRVASNTHSATVYEECNNSENSCVIVLSHTSSFTLGLASSSMHLCASRCQTKTTWK